MRSAQAWFRNKRLKMFFAEPTPGSAAGAGRRASSRRLRRGTIRENQTARTQGAYSGEKIPPRREVHVLYWGTTRSTFSR
jgi:hypothetical protein